ncbi:ABC transporter ATP-binding protein [Tamlana nanhaiensis]|uniref:ABC transporter ATP-binding protein n=1 Tax=Neotamlana nanhaiensis TaxID=1382798 RepID=A0A0D7W586_9FLAO|nr:HAD family phosphatase [Tamlana nanhaiensis]KJD34276.1 ABC transporter ATP-binding protein [Tamlana nanhaiensis]
MLKAVIFDMDGVIIDSEPLHYKAYHRMFKDVDINVSSELYESFTGQSTLNVCKRLCDTFNLKEAPETLVKIKRKHHKHIFENDDDLQLIPGVLEAIKDYHANGLKLVLASSASMVSIELIFKRFELDQYFSAKFSGADLKQSKPHPEIFIKAAQSTGFNNEECVVIEDSTNGIKAANAAGIFCVGYDSLHSTNQDYSTANFVVNSFDDISFEKLREVLG